MKTHRCLIALITLIFLFGFSKTSTAASGKYSAHLVSPTAGQILYPGQQVRVAWNAALPDIGQVGGCEMEVWLSLDGGRNFTMCLTPHVDPKIRYFYWTVPNTPTNAAVLDIRFGCEWYYPESYAPQPASSFVIANTVPTLY